MQKEKSNKRIVLYFTHRMKIDDMESLTLSVDKEKRNIMFMKIKLNIELTKNEEFRMAYIKLRRKYE
jgi:hypothetical protein